MIRDLFDRSVYLTCNPSKRDIALPILSEDSLFWMTNELKDFADEMEYGRGPRLLRAELIDWQPRERDSVIRLEFYSHSEIPRHEANSFAAMVKANLFCAQIQ